MRWRFYILLLLQVFCLVCGAQHKEFVFDNFTQKDGIPSKETYYIFEDSKHHIWIATDMGVVRYNGDKFESFQLPDNVVFKIREDEKGRIWFFTNKAQLSYYKNGKIIPFHFNQAIAARIKKINIIDGWVDESDNIYLNSAIDSNYIIGKNGAIKAICHTLSAKPPLEIEISHTEADPCFTTMTLTPSDIFWRINFTVIDNERAIRHYSIEATGTALSHYGSCAGPDGSIYFFGGQTLAKLYRDGRAESISLPSAIISVKYYESKLFAGTLSGGLYIFNKGEISLNNTPVLNGKSITSILVDFEGGLWLSTLENGVLYAKNPKITNLNPEPQSAAAVNYLMPFSDSILYFANANGIYEYRDEKSKIFFPLKNYSVNHIFTDNCRKIYISGSFDTVSKAYPVTHPFFKTVCLYESPSPLALIGSDTIIYSLSGSVIKFKSNFYNVCNPDSLNDHNFYYHKETILSEPARLYTDQEKTVWALTKHGIYISSSPYNKFSKMLPQNSLLSQGANYIADITKNIKAVSLSAGGIMLLEKNNVIKQLTQADGLAGNKIKYLFAINNQLWVATANGISVIVFSGFNPLKYNIFNIGKKDGLYDIVINQISKYQNNIVVATSNGIFFIEDPESILKENTAPVPFYISGITMLGRDTSNISEITLPYSQNRLGISYSAISFNDHENIQYLYRFANRDTNWLITSTQELQLENMEPGIYQLQIKAIIPGKKRASSVQTISITIEKPWWQNNWFRLCMMVLTAGSIYFFVRKRIQKIQKEAAEKTALHTRMAELEQTALRSQMNPHFIFNCLTSIQQLIISGDKMQANEHLVKFARLIRKTLELSAQPFISIEDEISYLSEYMYLEQLRLGNFSFSFHAAEDINQQSTCIPNMMLQPVVENCIRHGIKGLDSRKGIISVQFRKVKNQIECVITDNGTGRNKQTGDSNVNFTRHKSYGIDIIKNRLQSRNDSNNQASNILIEDLLMNREMQPEPV